MPRVRIRTIDREPLLIEQLAKVFIAVAEAERGHGTPKDDDVLRLLGDAPTKASKPRRRDVPRQEAS